MALYIRNGKWHWRFQVLGKRWSGSTDLEATKRNENAAKQEEARNRLLIANGRAHELKIKPVRFSEAAAEFLEWYQAEHSDRPSTWKRERVSFASLKEFFGEMAVAAVTPGLVERYKTMRRSEHKVKEITLRHDLHALSGFFQYAVLNNWAHENPVRKVAIPSDRDSMRMYVLSPDDERRYFEKVARFPNMYDLGRLLLLQGMRPNEIYQARLRDLDLDRRQLRIPDSKTRAGRRTLELVDESFAILARRAAACARPESWLFPGRPRSQHITRPNRSHTKALADSGLDFVIYDFRHTFATRMGHAGCDPMTLARILGHSDLKMVMRYCHPTQEHQKAAMGKYQAYLNEITPESKWKS